MTAVINYRMLKSRLFWMLSVLLIIGILTVLNYKKSSMNVFPSYRTSSMENLHLKHREGNEVKWELTAEKAILPAGNKEVFLKFLALTIKQSPEIYLTSASGLYEIENGNVTLSNSVELNMKDTTFATDSLKWQSKDNLITTDDTIKVSSGKFLIKGTGLTANTDQQKVRILKDVEATFYR